MILHERVATNKEVTEYAISLTQTRLVSDGWCFSTEKYLFGGNKNLLQYEENFYQTLNSQKKISR